MAKRYRPVVRDQAFLFPPDMREWLPSDHAVWLVIRVVEEHLDTSVVHAGRKTGGAGAAGYDPVMLLTLLVWAYACGVTSSRRIEAACRQDVAFRVICAQDVPDHVTVARFRQEFPAMVQEMFAQVLVLCARLGMGKVGTVTLDGTKIAASASTAANRTEERLRKIAAERAAAHAAADAAEDGLFGDARGDEVQAGAADPRTRDGRIAAALADLEAERTAREAEERAKAAEYTAAAAAGAPKPGRPPRGAQAEAARIRVDRETAAQQARIEDWQRRAGHGRQQDRTPPGPAGTVCPGPEGCREGGGSAGQAGGGRGDAGGTARAAPVRNITDPDSRLMPVRGGGFIQGYNAQNVVTEDGLVIATRLTDDTTDYGWYEPMITDAMAAAAMMAARRPPGPDAESGPGLIGLVLADAGYCSEHNLTCAGPDRLIATGKHRDLENNARAEDGAADGAEDGSEQTAIAAMTARLATADGITAYRQRSHIAETPHGHIKHNMGFRQLSLRGNRKAAAEWAFTVTVANLLKAITAGHLTRQALDHLTAPAS